MTPRIASRLVRAEYDFAQVAAALADLGAMLHECAEEAPECAAGALTLRALRRRLMNVWRSVEPGVSEAQAVVETIEAPF